MLLRFKHSILLSTVILISGCAQIEHTSNVEQTLSRPMIAGIGDVVLRVNKERPLMNAFGKADIFGRKTNEGYSELKFAGVESTGEVVLYRKDTKIFTNETTMSRTPMSISNGSATTNSSGNIYSNNGYGALNASSTTNYIGTTLHQASDYHVIVPSETIAIRLSPDERKLPIEGYVIQIIKATKNSLEYQITQQ